MVAQLVNVALGVWLMASPGVLDYGEPASTSSWIAGPVVVSVAFIAAFQVGRAFRFVNVPVGAWLLLAPLVLGYDPVPLANSLAVGAAVTALSLVRGRTDDRYAGGWASLFR